MHIIEGQHPYNMFCNCQVCESSKIQPNQMYQLMSQIKEDNVNHIYSPNCQCGNCIGKRASLSNIMNPAHIISMQEINDFKNWFEGFSYGVQMEKEADIIMTAEQWSILCDKIKTL